MRKNSRVKIYIPRKQEEKILKYLPAPEIIAVVGARQVGKTTLLKHIYNRIEAPKVFLDFEDPEILSIFDEDVKVFARLYVEKNEYIFIDEFQYAQEGGRKLKFLFDHYASKILISGSSSLDITLKISSALVGRIFSFELFPLSFEEFLNFKFPEALELIKNHYQKKKPLPSGIHKKLISLIEEFVLYGGFPRATISEEDEEKREVLKNLLSSYFMKDIRGFFKISTEHSFQKVIKALALQVGSLLNYTELSNLGHLSLREVKKYLEILEETYIIALSRPFYSNKRTELVKNPKVYFIDSGLRNSIAKDFRPLSERADAGALLENFIAAELLKSGFELKFWRTKSGAEVDFIIEREREIFAIEVKAGERRKPGKSLLSFISKYRPAKAFIFHGGNFSYTRFENTEIFFLPFYFFLPFILRE